MIYCANCDLMIEGEVIHFMDDPSLPLCRHCAAGNDCDHCHDFSRDCYCAKVAIELKDKKQNRMLDQLTAGQKKMWPGMSLVRSRPPAQG